VTYALASELVLSEKWTHLNPETTALPEFRPMTPGTTSRGHDGRCRLAWWTLAFALICGGVLRSAWIEDIEWKQDEQWTYLMSQEVGRTRPWPWVGMRTSLGFPNPGLSVWIFVPIGRIASTPTSMARIILFINMIALIGFAAAVRRYLPPTQREPWIWGLALQAVSPFAIRLSRKIWPPSILTLLLLLLWISHRRRESRWGAVTWGLAGALIGQVHLSGWFVATGLVVGTLVAEWRNKIPRSRYWHWWLLGTVVGLSSAVSWARTLPKAPLSLPPGSIGGLLLQHLIAYLYGLAAAGTSLFPFSALGLGLQTRDYELGPIIDGVATHATTLAGWFVFLAIVARIMVRLIDSKIKPAARWVRRNLAHSAGRLPARDAVAPADSVSRDSEWSLTSFYLWSTIAIPGAVFILTTDQYFYHYNFVFCPFLFVMIAACMLPWRRVLFGLVVAQALMGYTFLNYIHQHGGIVLGEYGLSYARQMSQ
jgi:hypothetical protein